MSAQACRRYALWFAVAAALCAPADPGRADHGPVIVMPNPPYALPPLLDGVDATGAVIEGDWGLYRPGTGQRMIYFPARPIVPVRSPPHYFPMTGRRPRYGRQEVEPPPGQAKPPPAQSYYRSWSVESADTPVTSYPPYDPPTVIEAAPPERRLPRKLRRRAR